MFVYSGTTYTVTVAGMTWKAVRCANCSDEWAYKVAMHSSGRGHSPYHLDDGGAQGRARREAQGGLGDLAIAPIVPQRIGLSWT